MANSDNRKIIPFQLLNETVSESLAVVDDVRDFHHSQITNLDAKVDENEESFQILEKSGDRRVFLYSENMYRNVQKCTEGENLNPELDFEKR